MFRSRSGASLAPQLLHLIDGLLGLGLRLLLARLRERELGVGLGAHQNELGAFVVAVLHELLGLLHFFLGELHRQRGSRHAARADFLSAPDGRLGGRDPLGGCRIAAASDRKYCAHDETRKLYHAIPRWTKAGTASTRIVRRAGILGHRNRYVK